MKAGFGLNNHEHTLIMSRNDPARTRNIVGRDTAVSNYSMAGAATNLPKPKPVIAKPVAKPL